MPFVSKAAIERLYPPVTLPGISEGDWVDIRAVYTAGIRADAMRRGMKTGVRLGGANDTETTVDLFAYRQALVEAIVVAWSDAEPVTPEALAGLHPDVQDWIAGEFDRIAEGRGEEEKKDSISDSSPPSEPVTAGSPVNSRTSGK